MPITATIIAVLVTICFFIPEFIRRYKNRKKSEKNPLNPNVRIGGMMSIPGDGPFRPSIPPTRDFTKTAQNRILGGNEMPVAPVKKFTTRTRTFVRHRERSLEVGKDCFIGRTFQNGSPEVWIDDKPVRKNLRNVVNAIELIPLA